MVILARAFAQDLELLAQNGRAPSAGLVESAKLLAVMASASAPRTGGLLDVQLLAGQVEETVDRLAWLIADAQRRGAVVGRDVVELVWELSSLAEQLVNGMRSEGD